MIESDPLFSSLYFLNSSLPTAPSRSRFGRARPVGRGMSRRERCDFVMCCYLGLYKNKGGG